MTYPQQPGVPGMPQAPQQPQGYPPQQPYPPQQGYAPQQPGYPPQYGQQFAPQGYAQPQQPQPQLATGTLDQFFSQPSAGGGAALKFDQIGTSYVGVVARPITNGDIQQQTQVGTNGVPAFYKDGRPKFVMKVPLRVAPSPTHQDGLAQWFCSGQARDALVRAMAEVGAPEGPPESGAVISITYTSQRPAGAGMNPAKNYSVRYWRPDDPTGQQYAAQCGIAPQGQQGQQQAQQQAPQPPAQPQYQPPQPPAPQPQQQAPQQAPQPPAPPAQPPAAPQAQPPALSQQQAPQQAQPQAAPPAPPSIPTEGLPALDPAQQQLLAQLTGQPAA